MSARSPSRLERRFALIWRAVGGPKLTAEFRFHPTRRWRADFAHEASRTLIELEGGVWIGGRHTRGQGFVADAEKYLEATLSGWRVLRLVETQITTPTLSRIISFLIARAPDFTHSAADASKSQIFRAKGDSPVSTCRDSLSR